MYPDFRNFISGRIQNFYDIYKSTSKYFIFYIFNNRKECNGKGKIDLKDNKFI